MKQDKLQTRIENINDVRGDHIFRRLKINKKMFYRSTVYMTCPEGHDYNTRYDCFVLRGYRCKKCANRVSVDSLISKIEREQGDHKFIRIVGEYAGVKNSYGEFLCPSGHTYQTRTYSFLRGVRCSVCAGNKSLTFDERKQNIDNVRGDHIFRGFEPNFKNSKSRILMTCPYGHDYKSIYGDFILKHSRCPVCNKERLKLDVSKYLWNPSSTEKSYFYIQTLSDKYIKFGISFRDPNTRLKQQSKKSIFDHKLVFVHQFDDGWKAHNLECIIKSYFNCGVVCKEDMQDGYTETLKIENLNELKDIAEKFIAKPPQEPYGVVDWL